MIPCVYRAYRAARDDDEYLEFMIFNRRGDQYLDRVREGTERRIQERDELERIECEREREAAKRISK